MNNAKAKAQEPEKEMESLVRHLRKRQQEFFSYRWKGGTRQKQAALDDCKALESQIIGFQAVNPTPIGMLAEWMIGLQRKFFQTRGPLARREAVDAERRVDQELDRLATANQTGMFD